MPPTTPLGNVWDCRNALLRPDRASAMRHFISAYTKALQRFNRTTSFLSEYKELVDTRTLARPREPRSRQVERALVDHIDSRENDRRSGCSCAGRRRYCAGTMRVSGQRRHSKHQAQDRRGANLA